MTQQNAEGALLELINALPEGKNFKNITEKIIADERISDEEGMLLFEKASLGLNATLANYIREKKHGNKTYFNRNFHIEPTNVCVFSCKFCSYSRLYAHRDEGWVLTKEQMMNYVLCSFREDIMFRAVVEEAAALTSVALFVGMIAVWAQVFAVM